MRDDSDKHGLPEGDETLFSLYRDLGDEEPPAALDAAILRAAREHVDRAADAAAARRRAAYSIAASLLLSITAVLMFSRLELFAPASFEEAAPVPNTVTVDLQAGRGGAPAPASPALQEARPEALSREEAPLPALGLESPRLPQIPPQSPVAPPAAVLEPLRLQLPAEEQGDAVVSNSPLPPPVRRANTTQEALQADTAEIREEGELEEIVVTGSRIRSYRDEPDSWLEQIQALLDQGSEEEAEEELALFRERYPEREAELDFGGNE